MTVCLFSISGAFSFLVSSLAATCLELCAAKPCFANMHRRVEGYEGLEPVLVAFASSFGTETCRSGICKMFKPIRVEICRKIKSLCYKV